MLPAEAAALLCEVFCWPIGRNALEVAALSTKRTSKSRISKSQREIWCFATEKPAEIFTSFILSSAGQVPIPDPSACQACMLCLSKPARCPRRSPFPGECHLSIFLVLRFPRNDGFPDKSHVTCSSFKNLDDTVALPLSAVELRRSKK